MSRCQECENPVTSPEGDFLTCTKCKGKYHNECSGLAASTLRAMGKKKRYWVCKRCRELNKSRQNSQSTEEDNHGATQQENSQENVNEDYTCALNRIERKLEEVSKTNDKILESMKFINKQYEDIKKENIEIRKENQEVKKRLNEVEIKLDELTKKNQTTGGNQNCC